ncbi:MAG: GNAT family N-acetyltransferase [Prolixibacteraceae bacterium]|nr:GNAT family N-acetyltransferase [Prolixibacteraceae bacterium]
MEYLLVDDDIYLEKILMRHAPVVFDAIDRSREYLRVWLPFIDYTNKQKDTEDFINATLKLSKENGDDTYTIWHKGDFAGLIGYKDSDPINRKTEIGYWLVENMQRKGIMIRSVKKLTDFAFRNMNRNRVQIKVAVGNLKSAAIPLKLGFTFEGIERESERHSHRYFDIQVYSLLKREWAESLIQKS